VVNERARLGRLAGADIEVDPIFRPVTG